MDRQAVFDKVATHLLTQKKRANSNGRCKYRHGELKCAIGCLIPDELYTDEIEQIGVTGIFKGGDVAAGATKLKEILLATLGEITPEDGKLLARLQQIHDDEQPRAPAGWRASLQECAWQWNLNSAVLNQF